jgi:hypothetical protein
MSAVEAVRLARAAGIELTLDGNGLQLDAASEPPSSVIEELRRHKHEIVELLRCEHDRLEGLQHTLKPGPYGEVLAKLRTKCPDHVEPDRWQQAIRDADSFLAKWGAKAGALGWTARELFGLHPVPTRLPASYSRLSRYDETGLIWLLHGRPVVALSKATAVVQGLTRHLVYHKLNKPALGPFGDSLDDLGCCV